jgi:hypothetical protein
MEECRGLAVAFGPHPTGNGTMGGRALHFWKESFGPLRVNHCFAFVDAAKFDKDNGQYYQIGIIKYAFLD